MVQAGLLARNAIRRGLTVPAGIKTSLAPGSLATASYLDELGLQGDLMRWDSISLALPAPRVTACQDRLRSRIAAGDRPRTAKLRRRFVRQSEFSRAYSSPRAG